MAVSDSPNLRTDDIFRFGHLSGVPDLTIKILRSGIVWNSRQDDMNAFPKWPWIGCAICLLVFAFNAQRMGSIEKEAMPFFREMSRMQTGSYATTVNTEAFLRGFFYGDAFGKAYEEQAKGQNLQIILAGFEARYSSAKTWRNIAFWCALGFGIALFGTRRTGGVAMAR